MKTLILTSFLIGVIFLTGCYYDKEEQLYPNSANNTDCNAPLTYTSGIKTILDLNCAFSGCHATGAVSPDLTNYTSVTANAIKITSRAITIKDMPRPAGMSACNITKLDNWIKGGMIQ